MTTSIVSDDTTKSLSQIQTFENSDIRFQIGCVDCFEKGNELWFRLSDIAKVLEVGKNTASMWREWADEDEIEFKKNELGGHDIPYCSESLLYRILNRSNSPKAKPFERWVTKTVIPSIRKNGEYKIMSHEHSETDRAELEAKALLAHSKNAELLHELANQYGGKSENYRQILDAYATKEISGNFLLPLPEMSRKSYSAGEIGKILGISASKVGAIAIKNNLKIDEFGLWVHDKSKYSNKEVDTFRYYDSAIPEIRKFIADKKVIAETADKWLAAEKRR